MIQYHVIHGPIIRWKIRLDSSSSIVLKSLAAFSILNPYKFSKEYRAKKILIEIKPFCINGECFLTTSGIILRNKVNENIEDDLFDKLKEFFRYLRYESKQAEIQVNNAAGSILSYDKISMGTIPVQNVTGMTERSIYFFSNLSWQMVNKADRRLSNREIIPIYEEIFLEAIRGKMDREYNKVILFSVIALESLLAHKYKGGVTLDKNKNPKRKDFKINKNFGESYKDPVLKSLLDANRFKMLLHEIPLYLYNKSILVENKVLYDKLVKLYNTRNKIVHWGAPLEIDTEKMYPVNEKSAEIAINSANEVFNWVGIDRYNEMLMRKAVHIDQS